MQLRLLVGIFLILIAYTIIKRPFKNKGRVRELVNHMLLALVSYYGSYAVLATFGIERNQGISVAIGITFVVLLIANIFFRKPHS